MLNQIPIPMIKTVIIDSNKLILQGLKKVFSDFSTLDVIYDLSSLNELPKNISTINIGLVIIDPKSDTKINIEETQVVFPYAKIVVLTNLRQTNILTNYIKAGIAGLYSKSDCPTQIRNGIERIIADYNSNSKEMGSIIRQLFLDEIGKESTEKLVLTSREAEILQLVCHEKTNLEISHILGLSIRTIESHRRRMIDRSGSKTIIGVMVRVLELNRI
jgi:DNA-binding NarL/FixJ family response regulator